MSDLPAARRGDVALTLDDVARREHRRGRLLPLLARAATEAFLVEQAKALNLSVEPAELQHAADAFRWRRGLHPAALGGPGTGTINGKGGDDLIGQGG